MSIFSLYYSHIPYPSKFAKSPTESRRVGVIWHQARGEVVIVRQACGSQRELLIEYNGPQQEATVIYGLLDLTISAR